MITIDDKTYRNLQEQVAKNTELLNMIVPAFNSQLMKVKGVVNRTQDLPSTASNGDAYLVGTQKPYEYYLYFDRWIDIGEFKFQGDKGEVGPAGQNGLTPNIYINPDNKHWMINHADTGVVAQGKNGVSVTGPRGNDGSNGKTGPKGDKGDPGNNALVIEIKGHYDYPIQLPSLSGGIPLNYAYLVGTQNDLYVQSGGRWTNLGQLTMIQTYTAGDNIKISDDFVIRGVPAIQNIGNCTTKFQVDSSWDIINIEMYANGTQEKVIIYYCEGWTDPTTTLIPAGWHMAQPYGDQKILIDNQFILNQDSTATKIRPYTIDKIIDEAPVGNIDNTIVYKLPDGSKSLLEYDFLYLYISSPNKMNGTVSGDYITDNLFVLPINRNYNGSESMLFYNWLMFSDESLNLSFQVEIRDKRIYIMIWEFVTSSTGGSYFTGWHEIPGSTDRITGCLEMRLQGVTLS